MLILNNLTMKPETNQSKIVKIIPILETTTNTTKSLNLIINKIFINMKTIIMAQHIKIKCNYEFN